MRYKVVTVDLVTSIIHYLVADFMLSEEFGKAASYTPPSSIPAVEEVSIASWLSGCELVDSANASIPLSSLVKNEFIAVSDHLQNHIGRFSLICICITLQIEISVFKALFDCCMYVGAYLYSTICCPSF